MSWKKETINLSWTRVDGWNPVQVSHWFWICVRQHTQLRQITYGQVLKRICQSYVRGYARQIGYGQDSGTDGHMDKGQHVCPHSLWWGHTASKIQVCVHKHQIEFYIRFVKCPKNIVMQNQYNTIIFFQNNTKKLSPRCFKSRIAEWKRTLYL